jgi:hypothetical protein
MRRLVHAGAPPGDAARAALAAEVGPAAPLVPPVLIEPAGRQLGLAADPALAAVDAWPDDAALDDDLNELLEQLSGPAGGGNVVALPDSTPAVRGLGRAAMSLDSVACTDIVRDSLERRGVVWTWDHLLAPVLVGVGWQWERSGRGVEVEHVLSESIMSALTGVAARMRRPLNPRPVLLACADEDMHSLPLFAVAAALAERHIASRVLGARVPRDALVASIRRTGPAAVLVWSSVPGRHGADQLADLPSVRPAPLVLAAGPGWAGELPAGVARVSDLVDALTRISGAVAV